MNILNSLPGNALRAMTVAAVLSLTGCDAVNEAVDNARDVGNDAEVFYYVSVGTSLSVGVQPNGSGVVLPTDDGYPNALYNTIKPIFELTGNRELRLIKLGCPGETFETFANGGSCLYLEGSQLAAAADFLADNLGSVHLVTIDMGANDFRNADCVDTTVDMDCANNTAMQVAADLATVLTALQDAADPATTIIGVNYYNPFLATWLEDADGQTLAIESAQAVAVLNDALGSTYSTSGVPVADVAIEFASDDFSTMVPTSLPPPNDMVPLSVSNICEYTYMCDPDRGPDLHPTDVGYGVIADAIEVVLAN